VTPIVGCLGEPIAKRVLAGTTFTVPFGAGVFGATTQTAGNLLSPDPQRGNIRFVLCADNGCNTRHDLLVRYLTRIFPDPGSPLGLTGEPFPGFSNFILGEPIVILDVPGDTPGGSYTLASIVRPPGASESLTFIEPIEIVAKPEGIADAFSDLSRLAGGADISASMRGFIPNPQLVLVLADTANDRPAAGNFTVSYPRKVEIVGAFEGGVLGQNSIVRFKLLPDPPGADPNSPRKVAVTFLDPDKRLTKVNLAFTLSDANNPVTTGMFQVDPGSQALYTADGVAIPITDVVANAGNSFAPFEIR
jgi:hypothetical protein